jgi:hypothetical protein
METCGGSGILAPPFFISLLGGGERSASRPGRFTPRERAPSTHWAGGWVGTKTDPKDRAKIILTTDPEVRVRFPALPDFLRSSGSGTESTQPRVYN